MERRSTTRSTRTLGLWMNGACVGSWSLGPSASDTLQYDPEWTRSEQGRPLSLSMPFMPGNLPHRGPHVRAWFENLLPDGKDIRARMARRYRTGSTMPSTCWLKPVATAPARCRSCPRERPRPAWHPWRPTR